MSDKPAAPTLSDRLEALKIELGARMRWIGWGIVILLIVQAIYFNWRPEKLDLIVYSFQAPGIFLFAGILIAGFVIGKIVRAISGKVRQLEAKYRQRLREEGSPDAPTPTTGQA